MMEKSGKKPPFFTSWILKRFLSPFAEYPVMGDLEEEFYILYDESGTLKAKWWYRFQVLRSVIPFLKNLIYWSIAMFKNYFKIAYRNIIRHKSYSIINIMGLALGIACCILIIAFIADELTFDKFHENAPQIYRTKFWGKLGGGTMEMPIAPSPLAEALHEQFPEVLNFTRFREYGRPMLAYQDKKFYESNSFYADNNIFEMFSFKLLKGDPENALVAPNTIVITNKLAEKYFGDEEPLGKVLRHNNARDLTVTGVIEKLPSNSHIQFEALMSMKTLEGFNKGEFSKSMMGWMSFNFYTYLLFEKDTDMVAFQGKFDELIEEKMGKIVKTMGGELKMSLQPLLDIHLHSKLTNEMRPNGDIKYVYSFAGIAVIILLIACINFMNLSTARSANRAKEVGMRKVVGAFRNQLSKQFLGESLIYSVISLFVALILVEFALPMFNGLSGKEININYIEMPWLIAALTGIIFFTGIIAGSYPAILLSAFKPVQVLRGKVMHGAKSSRFRSILVVTQFAISITLIISTSLIYNQLNYMKNKELGFNKDQLLVLQLPSENKSERYEAIKSELLKFDAVTNAAVSSLVPAAGHNSSGLLPEGYEENKQVFVFDVFSVDPDFIETYGIQLVQGRNISKDLESDKDAVCLINETALRKIDGWDDAVGKNLYRPISQDMSRVKAYEVVGVFKDFHTTSLYQEIAPTVLYFDPGQFDDLTLRLKAENITSTMDLIESKWAEIDPSEPFEYFFVDDRFQSQYTTEENLGNIFKYFTALAIFIGCLGLFGLASFTAEQRTKEIGIRKTLGSSISAIIYLLCKDFVKLIVFANLVSWPVAYYFMKNWLTNFPYQVDIEIVTFAIAAIAAMLIALLTVSYQSIRAATANPVKSLRYE